MKSTQKVISVIKMRMVGLMFVLAFLLTGFQSATAQVEYVPPLDAINLLETTINEVSPSDYPNYVTPTSNGLAQLPPWKLEAIYLENGQIEIKAANDTQLGIGNAHTSFLEKFPNETQWATQFRNEMDALLQN